MLFTIAILFFCYENFTKIEWYIEKYGDTWPPIKDGELFIK